VENSEDAHHVPEKLVLGLVEIELGAGSLRVQRCDGNPQDLELSWRAAALYVSDLRLHEQGVNLVKLVSGSLDIELQNGKPTSTLIVDIVMMKRHFSLCCSRLALYICGEYGVGKSCVPIRQPSGVVTDSLSANRRESW
jgi:hypothetical protein